MPILVIKATDRCNSNCAYCTSHKAVPASSMKTDVVISLFSRINEYLKQNKHVQIELQWHGGEPLMAGPSFYQSVNKIQEEYCPQTKYRIRHSMQTNLTCLSDHYWQILDKLGVAQIGTSFDPEPHIRGFGKSIDSNKYNRKFIRAIGILNRYQIKWGLIYVVTKKSLQRPEAIFNYLTNLNLSGNINITPVFLETSNRYDLSITAEEYVSFLESIFNIWWQHKNRFPNIEPFQTITNNLLSRYTQISDFNLFDKLDLHLNISTDGIISKFHNLLEYRGENLGNISDNPFNEVFQRYGCEARQETIDRRRTGSCKDCRYWNLCFGGYKIDAFSQNMTFNGDDSWCRARQIFIEKVVEPKMERHHALS